MFALGSDRTTLDGFKMVFNQRFWTMLHVDILVIFDAFNQGQ